MADIYPVEDSNVTSKTKLTQEFFDKTPYTERADMWTQTFEITERFKLKPGSYVVIPCTFDPSKEGDFMLRVFSEKQGIIDKAIECITS